MKRRADGRSWRAALLVTWVLGAGGLSMPGVGAAEVRRVEAVGAVPIDPSQRGRLALRDKAIREALREAVFRVGRELLHEAEAPEESANSLDEVLEAGMVHYTTRFRILEDQGERPSLFSDDPGVATEYVVIVEAYVDVDRVKARLVDAGLMAAPQPSEERSRLWVEAYGLTRYPAYRLFQELVAASAGASSAEPWSLERGRAVLAVEVEGRLEPPELLHRLERLAPEGLEIALIELDRETLTVKVTWNPGEPEASEETVGEELDVESIPRAGSATLDSPWGDSWVEPSSEGRP